MKSVRQPSFTRHTAPEHKWKFSGLTDIIRHKKGPFVVYLILRTLVLIALGFSLWRSRYEHAFLCLLSLVLFLMPAFLSENFGIQFPSALEILVLFFIFAAEILGEIGCILNKNPRIKFDLSPAFLSTAAFCFSMTMGVMWEFFECSCDLLLHTDTQKDTILSSISSVTLNPDGENVPVVLDGITSVTVNGQPLGVNGYLDIGLIDTMKDLFVNFVGALVFSIIGFFYVKNRGRGRLAKHLIPTYKETPQES